MSDRGPLDGRVALVTGAASGIGRATAVRLAADGAVVGCLDRDGAGARVVAAGVAQVGGRAVGLAADVTATGGAAASSVSAGSVGCWSGSLFWLSMAVMSGSRPWEDLGRRVVRNGMECPRVPYIVGSSELRPLFIQFE